MKSRTEQMRKLMDAITLEEATLQENSLKEEELDEAEQPSEAEELDEAAEEPEADCDDEEKSKKAEELEESYLTRTDVMRALMDLCEDEEASSQMGAITDGSDHASTDNSESGDLHGNVESAWAELKSFMDDRPDLADPAVREQYLPIKQRYDDAIEALGRGEGGV